MQYLQEFEKLRETQRTLFKTLKTQQQNCLQEKRNAFRSGKLDICKEFPKDNF